MHRRKPWLPLCSKALSLWEIHWVAKLLKAAERLSTRWLFCSPAKPLLVLRRPADYALSFY